MQLHQLQPNTKRKSRKRVGRGGKRGTYSGRGVKGQKSRAGKKPRLGFAGGDTPFFKRLPKKRGQRGKLKIKRGVKRKKQKPLIINLEKIEKVFKPGEIVSPKTLLEKGMIGKIKKKIPQVKILGKGELTKKLEFKDVLFSKKVLVHQKSSDKLFVIYIN